LREMTYDFQVDAFVAKDISIISEHLPRLRTGFVDMALQTTPFTILWIVMGDGSLVGVTYEREHDVVGWHPHQVGGGGIIESIAIVESPGDNTDAIHLLVKRTINSVVKRYVEIIAPFPTPTSSLDVASGYFVDGGISYDATTPTSLAALTGLGHLPSATVGVTVDGIYVGTRVVATDRVSPGYLGTVFTAGYLYDSKVGILEPDGGSQAGSSQGKKKRVNEAEARVENTCFFKIANSIPETDEHMVYSSADDPLSIDRKRIVPPIVLNHVSTTGTFHVPTEDEVKLMSGDMAFAPEDCFEGGGRFEIIQDEPYPLNLLSLMLKLNTNE
jgi:hypothetical protein